MLDRLRDAFLSLERRKARYLVIDGIAAVLYGVPRATFDLDILIEATLENAESLLEALEEAGLGTATMITPQELLAHEIVIFQDKVRIDVQTRTPGLKFEDAWKRREIMQYRDVRFPVVSKEDLIASKRAAGRPRDLEDVRLLELSE